MQLKNLCSVPDRLYKFPYHRCPAHNGRSCVHEYQTTKPLHCFYAEALLFIIYRRLIANFC